jgi:ribonuclease HI
MSQPTISSFFAKSSSGEQPPINDEYTLFFDGCSKGNPGIAGAGAVLYKNGLEIWSKSVLVGKKETNNVAEYTGLIIGLEEAVRQNIQRVTVKGDSELVIKQVKGEYNAKSPNMIKLLQNVKMLQNKISNITFIHVYRSENARADDLSNQGILCEK